MFGGLKKKLLSSIDKFSKEEEKAAKEGKKEKTAEGPKQPKAEKKGLSGMITRKELSEKDIDSFFDELDIELMESNVAVEVIDFLRKKIKEKLTGTSIRRGSTAEIIRKAFEESIFEAVNHEGRDLEEIIKSARKEGRTACIIFLGFNGSGKTTSIAKTARYLMDRGYKPVLAAADTFRAASIEQLEHHGKKLGIKVIRHNYGADPAAVIFDAVKYAQSNHADVVLADTAGRVHTDKNLLAELEKITRVNKPDLKVLVIDSLTGNDAVEQARDFEKAAGVDAVILTKADVNEKGGSILSVCYTIRKPVLFLGVGQEYNDIRKFVPKEFARELLGD